jgi:POT family proton-dependent oligopeptide transporter
MKSTIMSFWLLTISLGNYLVSLINSNISRGGVLSQLTGASYYGFFIVLMGVVTICYLIRYRKLLWNNQQGPL